MIDYVSACTVGYANDEALVDLNDEEESSECPTLTIATLPKSGQVVLCSMECRLHLDNLEKVLRVGQQACERVGERLEESILQLA
jgi:exosome complex component RRP41